MSSSLILAQASSRTGCLFEGWWRRGGPPRGVAIESSPLRRSALVTRNVNDQPREREELSPDSQRGPFYSDVRTGWRSFQTDRTFSFRVKSVITVPYLLTRFSCRTASAHTLASSRFRPARHSCRHDLRGVFVEAAAFRDHWRAIANPTLARVQDLRLVAPGILTTSGARAPAWWDGIAAVLLRQPGRSRESRCAACSSGTAYRRR
jgi:hypothetical protein